jgi:predicted thioesterase
MSDEHTVSPGDTGTAEMVVQDKDLAEQVGSGDLPVLATPVLAALMERAAVDCLRGRLAAERTSVGVSLDITHEVATPKGRRVQAQAQLVEIAGRKYIFEVEASDEKSTIGRGRHERVVVNRETFMSRVLSEKA